ncbi:Transcription factor atf21 [Paramyrothecium foliicola]|nr:Transcription factor atf21 [Paramyrothecium foliicola]
MSAAFVEAWPPVVGNIGPTEHLARMGTILAAAYPPPSVHGQVDQVWPWSGRVLDTRAAPTTPTRVPLHSQPGKPHPITTGSSSSTTPRLTHSPDSHQDDARQTPASSQRNIRPPEPESTGPTRTPDSRRKMRETHSTQRKARFDPQSTSQRTEASANASGNLKKRGRKPKNVPEPTPSPPQQHDGPFDDEEYYDEDLDLDLDLDDVADESLPRDPRRRRTLERNRVAAKKCRVRKRDEASALASREQAVEDQNRYLSTAYNSLTTEVYLLKTELLRHTHCNCTLIQEYIANEARRSVDKMNASPSNRAPHSQVTPTHVEGLTRRSSYFDSESVSHGSQHSYEAQPIPPAVGAWHNHQCSPVDGTTAQYQHACNPQHGHHHQAIGYEQPLDGHCAPLHNGIYGQCLNGGQSNSIQSCGGQFSDSMHIHPSMPTPVPIYAGHEGDHASGTPLYPPADFGSFYEGQQ